MIPSPLAKPLPLDLCTDQIVAVPKQDRWQICYRLRDLQVPCHCPEDGTLRVSIHRAIDPLLIRSAVQQFTASRRELLDWLERCWQSDCPA